MVEADIVRGVWRNPDAGIEALRTYAVRWVAERDLSERTRELYRGLLARQIVPFIGGLDLLAITPARVRSWRRDLIGTGVGVSTVAKAYRLLRAILNTAADDEVIVRNPCRIKGAGVELTPERPVVGLAEVLALAAAMPPRYRVLVLLAVFGSMRWGELMGLRRPDIDLENASVNIERSVVELGTDRLIKEPRTQAGVRSVALPTWLVPELRHHLDTFAEAGSEGRVFIGSHGATPRRRNFATIWKRAKAAAGERVPADLHFHDLRHTGSHFAAASGASTRELMGRMGHASMRAALIYQHRTVERERMIADTLDAMLGTRE